MEQTKLLLFTLLSEAKLIRDHCISIDLPASIDFRDALLCIFRYESILKLKIDDISVAGNSISVQMASEGGFIAENIDLLCAEATSPKINISVSYNFDSKGGIFSSTDDFYKIVASSKHPSLPNTFYIIECGIGRVEGDSNNDDFIQSLMKFVNFVTYLSSLAHYHDEKGAKSSRTLIFISEREKPIEIEILLDDQIRENMNSMNLTLLMELCDVEAQTTMKTKEKKAVFYSSLSEFCGHTPPSSILNQITSKWIEFENLFLNNFSAYLNDFKLDKLKKELAESELSFTSSISDVINDSVTKLLAISASIAAIALLRRFSFPSFDEGVWLAAVSIAVFIISLWFGSWLVSKIVLAQQDKLGAVEHAKDMLFSVLKNKERDVSKLARIELSEVIKNIDTKLNSAKEQLKLFSRLSYLPILIYVFALIFAYGGPISSTKSKTVESHSHQESTQNVSK